MNKPALCECCGLINVGALLDARLEFCCYDCVEEGAAALCDNTGVYRMEMKCGCGRRGPVNYDDGSYQGYYCGGSERCIP